MKKTPVWAVCLMFLFMMWLFMSTCFGQTVDTVKVEYYYMDTSCHSFDVQTLYNQRCVKVDTGYYVIPSKEFLDRRKKPWKTPGTWAYKTLL